MRDDVLIRVQSVSKKFCRDLKRSLWYGVRDTVNDLLGRDGSAQDLRRDEFWAVNDVSFEVRRGECLGLIGRNGAGKTTLLKMLNGLIKPEQGRIEMRGQLGALIALGSGFNPILSGRENVYVNGAVLGMSKKKIDAKIDEIIDFAEIGEFIDAPVQSYSSGMQVRLGFAVATAMEPDVLLLDEVLAVGDTAFRIKCHRRISRIRRNAAVIFVSHEMPAVALISDRTLVLSQGEVHFEGDTSRGIEAYQALNEITTYRPETGFVRCHPPLRSFEIAPFPEELPFGTPVVVDMLIDSTTHLANVAFRVDVYNMAGICIANGIAENPKGIGPGKTRSHIEIGPLPLKAGRYLLSFSIADAAGEFLGFSSKSHEIVITGGHPGTTTDCQLDVRTWTNVDEADSFRATMLHQ